MLAEKEVKILNMDLVELEEKIKSLGAALIAEENQVNTIFKPDSKNPIKLEGYLRIRETENLLKDEKKIFLTFKKKVDNPMIKEYAEYETEIDDPKETIKILENLGYTIETIGNKYRKSYSLEGSRLDLDFWDAESYPHPYMEIEVSSEEKLQNIIDLLNIAEENISYLSIKELRDNLKTSGGNHG